MDEDERRRQEQDRRRRDEERQRLEDETLAAAQREAAERAAEERLPDPNAPWLDRAGRVIGDPPPGPPPPPGVTWPRKGEYADDYGFTPSEADWERMRQRAAEARKKRHSAWVSARPAECSAFQIRRASRLATRLFDFEVRTSCRRPLRVTQLAVLAAIRGAADGPRLSELAARLGMHKSTLTRSLQRLEARGLVELSPAPHDRRAKRARLTALGEEVVLAQGRIWLRTEVDFVRATGSPLYEIDEMHDRLIPLARAARSLLMARGVRGLGPPRHAYGAGSHDPTRVEEARRRADEHARQSARERRVSPS